MEWRDDGYTYDSNNNRVGYGGKRPDKSTGVSILAKLVIICFLIYGGKSIFGSMPKHVTEGFDYLFKFLMAIILLYAAIKVGQWLLTKRKR
jgi:hypothetical protein